MDGQLLTPNFDLIARPYRWLEYLTLGRSLERCRLHFLPQISDRRQALILGDGDGRFLSGLLTQNPALAVDAVDISATMLGLLRARCDKAVPSAKHFLKTHHIDALGYLATAPPKQYDLIVTHFFLDCLTQFEVDALVTAISARLTPGAIWLISDFRVPPGALRYPAKFLIRSLYLAFRIFTGLRTSSLPDHASVLARTFTRTSKYRSLLGILTTELWTFRTPT